VGRGPSVTRALGPAALGAIGAVALVVRIAYAAVLRRDYRPDSDADSYFQIARALSEGRGFVQSIPFGHDHPTAGRPPLYPVLVAPLFDLFGVHVGVAQAFNVVAGAGVAVTAAVAGAHIAGRAAGVWSGLVVACSPPLIANDVTTPSETTACLLLAAAVVALARGRAFAAGAAMGLLMLSRASAQWLLLALAAWVWWRFGWRHAVRFAVVALLVVAPGVVRNAVQVGGPVLVTTNWFNLNVRYSPEARADGGFVDAYNDPRFAVMRLRYTDEVSLDDALRERAVDALAADPDDVVRVVGSNVTRWFELTPGENDDPETLDGRHLGVRRATLPLFSLVSLAGATGLWRAPVGRVAAARRLGRVLHGGEPRQRVGAAAARTGRPRARDRCGRARRDLAVDRRRARRSAHASSRPPRSAVTRYGRRAARVHGRRPRVARPRRRLGGAGDRRGTGA